MPCIPHFTWKVAKKNGYNGSDKKDISTKESRGRGRWVKNTGLVRRKGRFELGRRDSAVATTGCVTPCGVSKQCFCLRRSRGRLRTRYFSLRFIELY